MYKYNFVTLLLLSAAATVSGINNAHIVNTSIANSASGRCAPLKHCTDPSKNHLYTQILCIGCNTKIKIPWYNVHCCLEWWGNTVY